MANENLNDIFYNLLRMTRDLEKAPNWATGLKLGEECGEVQEAILKDNGFLKHKEEASQYDVMYEVADVMNVCCAILTSTYKDATEEEILEAFTTAMDIKGMKYRKLLEDENR